MGGTVKKGLTGNQIKIIAMCAMFIDHFAAGVIANLAYNLSVNASYMQLETEQAEKFARFLDNLSLIYSFMRAIGRISFPIFIFLLIEGYMHTKSVLRYAINLFVFALISEIPFDLALNGGSLFELGSQNVFFTLFFGLIAIVAVDRLKNHKFKSKAWYAFIPAGILAAGIISAQLFYTSMIAESVCLFDGFDFVPEGGALLTTLIAVILVTVIVYTVKLLKIKSTDERIGRGLYTVILLLMIGLAEYLCTDYSGFGVFTIVLMYTLRKSRVKEVVGGTISLCVLSFNEIAAVAGLIPILKYNGRRGNGNKYFFYFFYPTHLLFIFIIMKLFELV